MPRISVISVAKTEEESSHPRKAPTRQTFEDLEFVTSAKGNVPQAWNDAISPVTGKIIVITESDAVPLKEHSLEDVATYAEKHLTGT